MIDARMGSLDITFVLDGNMFRQVTMSWTSDLVINFVNFLFGMEWKPNLMRSLIILMDPSMSPMCSFLAHVCSCDGDKKFQVCSN